MNLTQDGLSELLLKYDPASTGSPCEDEYDDEAKEFFSHIDDVENATDVHNLLTEIFDAYFGDDLYTLDENLIEDISLALFD